MEEKRRILFMLTILVVIGLVGLISFLFSSPKKQVQTSETKLSRCETQHDTYEVVEKNIKGKKYKLLVADTPAKSEYGLMNIKSKSDICGHDGMIFVFSNPGIQTFWNQNTLVDLKLYWMLGDKVLREDELVNITDNGIKIYSSILPVNVVVEVIR